MTILFLKLIYESVEVFHLFKRGIPLPLYRYRQNSQIKQNTGILLKGWCLFCLLFFKCSIVEHFAL